MRARAEYAIFIGLVAAVAAVGVAVARRPSEPASAVLAAAPRDAWLVVTVDVAALRGSALGRVLAGADGATRAAGLGTIADTCGFDPLERVRAIMVASPEGGERGDFGAAFSGDLTKEELAGCARKVIGARGGRVTEATRGSFTVVGGESPLDRAGHARFAYRSGGPFLVGRGAWLDAMIDAVDGRGERARREHDALRAALSPGGSTPEVVVTALLPKAVRERIRGEMEPALGAETDRSFQGVLAVDQAGMSVASGGAAATEVRLELRCETPAACSDVKELIERKRRGLQDDAPGRLKGLAPLLDSLSVETRGVALSAASRAPTGELADAVDRLMLALPRPTRAGPADAGPGERHDERPDAGSEGRPASDPNRQPGIGGL